MCLQPTERIHERLNALISWRNSMTLTTRCWVSRPILEMKNEAFQVEKQRGELERNRIEYTGYKARYILVQYIR